MSLHTRFPCWNCERRQSWCHFRTPQLSSQSKPLVQVAQRLPPRKHKAASLSRLSSFAFRFGAVAKGRISMDWNEISLPSCSIGNGLGQVAPRDSPPWEWQQRIWKSWWPRGALKGLVQVRISNTWWPLNQYWQYLFIGFHRISLKDWKSSTQKPTVDSPNLLTNTTQDNLLSIGSWPSALGLVSPGHLPSTARSAPAHHLLKAQSNYRKRNGRLDLARPRKTGKPHTFLCASCTKGLGHDVLGRKKQDGSVKKWIHHMICFVSIDIAHLRIWMQHMQRNSLRRIQVQNRHVSGKCLRQSRSLEVGWARQVHHLQQPPRPFQRGCPWQSIPRHLKLFSEAGLNMLHAIFVGISGILAF